MQTKDNKTLTFFAGGWGRGECITSLPENWLNNWHHIAGVSDGNSLKIFIDGTEIANQLTGTPVNLSTSAKWTVGRNEEFPEQRFFEGYIDQFKVFTEPLSQPEISREMGNCPPKIEP